jgi:hypothetical protein
MADIKINVKADADLSGVSSAMDVINQKAAELQSKLGKPINIAVENSDAISKIKEVGQADEEAKRRVTGAPASTTSDTPEEIVNKRKHKQLRDLNEEYKKHYGQKRDLNELDLKAHSAAVHRMSQSGGALGVYAKASGGDPAALGNMSPVASKLAFSRAGLAPQDAHHAATGNIATGMFGKRVGLVGSAALGMAGGMMAGGAGGGGASAAGGAIGGLVGMIGGPVGSMIGGALGSAIGGVVGGGMSGAQKEAISTTDLRSSLGALSVDFDQLSNTVKTAGNGLGLMSEETIQLASRFSKSAGLAPGQAGQIGLELKNAIGFSRGYGLDPNQGVNFFSTMRMTGAANDDSSNRKLGSVISESIVRSGNLSKTDEVLAAVGNFASMTARLTLARPNVEGFSSALSNLTMGHRSGLDVQSAASLIQNMDSGYRGNNSEQGSNVRLAAYQQAYGGGGKFNVMDAKLMQEQGIYGTYRDTLNNKLKGLKGDNKGGKNNNEISAVEAQLKDKNLNLDKTGGQAMVEFIQKQSPNDPSMQRKAFAHQFGIAESQAGEVMKAMSGSRGGGLFKQLGNMSAVNQPMAYQILGEKDPTKLSALAEKFISGEGIKGTLASSDKDLLRGQIDKKDESGLKNSLMQILQHTEVSDEGTQLRETTAAVGQAVNAFAAKLLPLTEFIKSGILAIAQKLTGFKEGEFEDKQREKLNNQFEDSYSKSSTGKAYQNVKDNKLRNSQEESDLRKKLSSKQISTSDYAAQYAKNRSESSDLFKKEMDMRHEKERAKARNLSDHGLGTEFETSSAVDGKLPALLGKNKVSAKDKVTDGDVPPALLGKNKVSAKDKVTDGDVPPALLGKNKVSADDIPLVAGKDSTKHGNTGISQAHVNQIVHAIEKAGKGNAPTVVNITTETKLKTEVRKASAGG